MIFLLFVCLELLTGFMEMVVNAKEESTKVIGKVYEFEEKDSYEFSKRIHIQQQIIIVRHMDYFQLMEI